MPSSLLTRYAGRAGKRALSWITPHGAVVLWRQRHDRARKRRLEALDLGGLSAERRPFDYEAAIGFLVARGLSDEAIRLGSIPAESVEFLRRTLAGSFPSGSPVHVLHVGNFVGLSLAAVSDAVRALSEESLVVSIDPNIPHLGIENPQQETIALLSSLGLQRHNLVLCGYTLEKTLGSDGVVLGDYDPVAVYEGEASCENVLLHLERLGFGFDVVVLDGSHIGPYLLRELAVLVPLLRDGGLLAMDDVSESWEEIREIFRTASEGRRWPLERVDYDGRVGILRKVPAG